VLFAADMLMGGEAEFRRIFAASAPGIALPY
jgi:hypothetical protein